jgi:hypothetical protein
MVDVLERYVKSRERQVAQSVKRDDQVTRSEAKRWWPFGTRTETKGERRKQRSKQLGSWERPFQIVVAAVEERKQARVC